jgi:hypothetical protein
MAGALQILLGLAGIAALLLLFSGLAYLVGWLVASGYGMSRWSVVGTEWGHWSDATPIETESSKHREASVVAGRTQAREYDYQSRPAEVPWGSSQCGIISQQVDGRKVYDDADIGLVLRPSPQRRFAYNRRG